MAHIRLKKEAFFHNLSTLQSLIDSKDKIAIVLKDNAYGHGLEQIAKLAKEFGITKAFVKNISEAQKIAHLFDRIGVFYPESADSDSPNMFFWIHSLDKIPLFEHKKIELKINSGLNRNGIQEEDIEQALFLIKKHSCSLEGVCTHYGYGDNLGSELFWEIDNFDRIKSIVLDLCSKYSIKTPLFHSCNSSSFFRKMHLDDDFARIGIAAYGYLCWDKVFGDIDLKPVASLWAERISKKYLKKGDRIGYGGISSLDKDNIVSSYDIGYGDGFSYLNKNYNLYTANGDKILPKISMDCLSVQSDKECICLFDDAKKIAKTLNTIPYDILVKLSPYIKRVIV